MTRTINFRYIIVRDGADYMEIYPMEGSAPTIRMDDGGEIKTSLSGSFADPGDAVSWLSDHIRPEMILDGVTYPLGIFLAASVRTQADDTRKYVSIEAYDQCWILRDTKTESLQYFASGTKYLAAVQSLLTDAGISLVNATPSDAVLAEAREDWDIGTSYLEIINQLLSEINYNPIWFDQNGMAILEPASTPSAANIEHTLDDTNVESLLLPKISSELDAYQAPNVFVVVCSNADKTSGMVASAENTNPQSPLSIARRGRRIVTVEQVDNIADQTELQAYANRLRNASMISGEAIEVTTGLLPGFGVADVVALRYGDLFTTCIEHSWSMQLQVGGSMRHSLEKVVINIG